MISPFCWAKECWTQGIEIHPCKFTINNKKKGTSKRLMKNNSSWKSGRERHRIEYRELDPGVPPTALSKASGTGCRSRYEKGSELPVAGGDRADQLSCRCHQVHSVHCSFIFGGTHPLELPFTTTQVTPAKVKPHPLLTFFLFFFLFWFLFS